MIIKKKDDKFTSKIISILRYFSYVTTTLLILLLILFNNKLFFKNLHTDISAKVNHRLFLDNKVGIIVSKKQKLKKFTENFINLVKKEFDNSFDITN